MLAQTVQQQVSSMNNAMEPILAVQWLYRHFLWPMPSPLQRDLYCRQRQPALAHCSSPLPPNLRLLQLLVHTAQSLWHHPDPKWQPLHPHPEVQQFASICHAGSPASQHHLGLKHPMRPVRYIHPVNGLPDISVLHRQIPTTRAIRQYLQSAIPAGSIPFDPDLRHFAQSATDQNRRLQMLLQMSREYSQTVLQAQPAYRLFGNPDPETQMQFLLRVLLVRVV